MADKQDPKNNKPDTENKGQGEGVSGENPAPKKVKLKICGLRPCYRDKGMRKG